jgi:hypothetical protein
MSQYPVQRRTVDPFATYNSDTVNKLTRMTTFGQNVLERYSSLRCTIVDGTSKTIVTLSPGVVYKDDVRLEMPESTLIDFEDPDYYVNFGPGFNEEGYYYILLEYKYEKSRPAPQAKIAILKPSQRSLFDFNTDWVLLQVAEVEFNTPHFEIMLLHDSDPEDFIKKRRYLKKFAGTETEIPSFENGDQSRIVYDVKTDKFWFGYIDRWAEAGGAGGTEASDINTSLATLGEVCKIDSTGFAVATLADSFGNQADLVCTKVGTTDGKGITSGVVKSVLVQTGVLISKGDLLYLSNTEPGRVTNIKTIPLFQLVGRALENASVTTPVKMIFDPDIMLQESYEGQITTWIASGTTPPYYHDIDVSVIGAQYAILCSFFNDSTKIKVDPPRVQLISQTLRIFNNNNTDIINFVVSGGGDISGGGGGGGGGIVTDHNLLTNLTYATSGHIGFTPSPHDNTHHSATYITAAGVTFANLNSNGSVGTGAVQVSFGNHTHSEFTTLNSIPSGSKMLFYSDVAIVGWTIITAIDDSVVYITKGSAVGGVSGAAYKPGSTWSQPLHAHSVATHVHDMAGHYHGFTMPAHTHTYSGSTSYEIGVGINRATGGDNSHYHTYSGTTDASSAVGGNTGGPSAIYTGVGGPSITGDNATSSGWRPYGFTFTLQQRI